MNRTAHDAMWSVRIWFRGLRCLAAPHVPGWSVGRFDDGRCLHCRKWVGFSKGEKSWGLR